MGATIRVTCSEYRQEMLLLSLRRQLADPGLSPERRSALEENIRELEAATGIDDPPE